MAGEANPNGNPILRVCAGVIGAGSIALVVYDVANGDAWWRRWWILGIAFAMLAYAALGNRMGGWYGRKV